VVLYENGITPPLAAIEDKLVGLIHQMSRIRKPLSVGEGIHLCNSLI
jgi:hypothetical protein